MPTWIVETFGHGDLSRALWLISGMTVPFWLAMLFFSGNRLVQHLCHPLLFPTLLCGIQLYLYWIAWSTGLPELDGYDYQSVRPLVRHPLIFLSLWCHIMILNFFLGTVLFREANRLKMRIPVELVLAWALGPIALPVYAVHLALVRR